MKNKERKQLQQNRKKNGSKEMCDRLENKNRFKLARIYVHAYRKRSKNGKVSIVFLRERLAAGMVRQPFRYNLKISIVIGSNPVAIPLTIITFNFAFLTVERREKKKEHLNPYFRHFVAHCLTIKTIDKFETYIYKMQSTPITSFVRYKNEIEKNKYTAL